MFKIFIIGFIINLLLILQTTSFAQYPPKSIAPYHIAVGYSKTSNLIFPYAIKSVDRGSTALLAQKALGVENILQIKAGEQNFKETNLTVITANGQFYSFIVDYTNEPAVLNFSFVNSDSEKAIIKDQSISEAAFVSVANTIKSKRHQLHKTVKAQDVKLSLNNIFIKDDILWLEFTLTNESPIVYKLAYNRFFIQDIKKVKRTAMQENEIVPLYSSNTGKINKNGAQSLVYAFKPFTLSATKELIIQIGEEGSRLLTLPISQRTMRKIKSL